MADSLRPPIELRTAATAPSADWHQMAPVLAPVMRLSSADKQWLDDLERRIERAMQPWYLRLWRWIRSWR